MKLPPPALPIEYNNPVGGTPRRRRSTTLQQGRPQLGTRSPTHGFLCSASPSPDLAPATTTTCTTFFVFTKPFPLLYTKQPTYIERANAIFATGLNIALLFAYPSTTHRCAFAISTFFPTPIPLPPLPCAQFGIHQIPVQPSPFSTSLSPARPFLH